jgi:hypothetical protein
MNRVGKLDEPTTSAGEPGDGCSRCEAGATVANMVRSQALWMYTLERGECRPPAALWEAVLAEDWLTVRREWDRWVWPELREMDRAGRDWRALASTAVQVTVKELISAGVSSPSPGDLDAGLEPDAILREWLSWIRKGIASVKDDARRHEWERFVEALPVELQAVAVEHPERQAEVAACVFETDVFHRGLLDKEGDG